MGLFQEAVKFYDAAEKQGIVMSDTGIHGASDKIRETLLPLYHGTMNAGIEIAIDMDGNLQDISVVAKEDQLTIAPMSIESSTRTSAPCSHPLVDNVKYVAEQDSKIHSLYMNALQSWCSSSYGHPRVQAVLKYVSKGTVSDDLNSYLDKYDDKTVIRWVVYSDDSETKSRLDRDSTVAESWMNYYSDVISALPQDISYISGEIEPVINAFPKSIARFDANAKLISSQADSGAIRNYSGRFTTANEALSIGHVSSQKAHLAIRYLLANYSEILRAPSGKDSRRYMVVFTNAKKPLPQISFLDAFGSQEVETFEVYNQELHKTIFSQNNMLPTADNVIAFSLESPVPGRLSICYYAEMGIDDYIQRVLTWKTTCSAMMYNYTEQKEEEVSPAIRKLIRYAYGHVSSGDGQETYIESDKQVINAINKMIPCIIEGRPIPLDIVKNIANKISQLYLYKYPWDIVAVAAAAIRKEHIDHMNRKDYGIVLNREEQDKSYVFGRIIALYDAIERSTYDSATKRQTNAIKMIGKFVQSPLHTSAVLEQRLTPYMDKLNKNKPGLYNMYRKELDEAYQLIENDGQNNAPLTDLYVLGMHHQRAALWASKSDKAETTEPVTSAESDSE